MAFSIGSPPIASDALVLYLTAGDTASYPGTGNIWYDVAGSNNGTLTNGPTFDSGNGGSIAFDGINDYVTIASTPPSLQGNSNLTVCGWFKRTQSSVQQRGVWGIGGEATGGGLCSWNYDNTNEIAIDLWNTSTFTTGVTYPLNEWVFVAWQKIAGNMTRANCIIWRNLVSYTGNQLTVLRSEGPSPNINNYGCTLGSISRTTGYCLGMNIASFSVYNKILSSDEITQIFNANRWRFGI
jgi:hypothetical protein